ncbi:uncharacterized protein LOC129097581 isoform X2 [Anoplopoma fimbria]|nr:uncharacterized protein LOC129097581 isoform X2 [Anoplopoma fimbria]
MDLPVEATVRLDVFSDQAQAKEILQLHGFALMYLSSDQVRVKGSFLKLKSVKTHLELLLRPQTQTVVPKASSGAISKRHAGNSSVSDGNRGRDKPPRASPSSPNASSSWASSPDKHPSSPEHNASFSPPPDQRGSFGPERESFVVDVEVLMYAEQLRQKDIKGILVSHDVNMDVCDVGESCDITLQGKSARVAAGKLQSLMNELSKSLRTQEVPLKDMGREGHDLLKRINKERNVSHSVVVRQMNDKLLLIGPSAASYELKQRLLGRPSERNPKRRSRNTDRDSGTIASQSPVVAAGYSSSTYQGDYLENSACFVQGGAVRERSRSESRENTRAEGANMQKMKIKRPSPKSTKNFFMQLGKKFKFWRK